MARDVLNVAVIPLEIPFMTKELRRHERDSADRAGVYSEDWGGRYTPLCEHDMNAFIAKANRNHAEAEGKEEPLQAPDCQS
jgi:hypothetical protein